MYTTGAMVKLVTTVLEISWRAWNNGWSEDHLQSEIGIVPWSNQWVASHVVWLLLLLYMYIDSLSLFSLAESLELSLEISATYRLVSYLLADNWLICRLCVQCMISIDNKFYTSIQVPCEGVFVIIFFKTMCKKTGIRFGFCDIQNNQGLGTL